MADNDTKKIFGFTVAMTSIVAIVLGLLFFGLSGIHAENEAVFNKRAILAAVGNYLPKPVGQMDDGEVQELFNTQIESFVINPDGEIVQERDASSIDLAAEKKKPESERFYPLYKYNDGQEDFFILSIRGNGLWDEIWGNVALKSDLATIAGASFDHKGETPGLGAEIKDNPKFAEQFQDKRIYDYNGQYTSVIVRKGGAKDPVYEVDGISGATVTANGVSEMLNRGIGYYRPYLEKLQAELPAENAVGLLLN